MKKRKRNFDEAETKEREVLKRIMKQVFKPTSFEFSSIGKCEVWDFKITYPKGEYLGEIKCRNVTHDAYDCIFLEEKKAKNLIYTGYKLGTVNTPLYLSHYTDDVVLIIKITPELLVQFKPEWRIVGSTRKLVYFIPTHLAKKIQLC